MEQNIQPSIHSLFLSPCLHRQSVVIFEENYREDSKSGLYDGPQASSHPSRPARHQMSVTITVSHGLKNTFVVMSGSCPFVVESNYIV